MKCFVWMIFINYRIIYNYYIVFCARLTWKACYFVGPMARRQSLFFLWLCKLLLYSFKHSCCSLAKSRNRQRSLSSPSCCCQNVFGILEGIISNKMFSTFCCKTPEHMLLNILHTKEKIKLEYKFHANSLQLCILPSHSTSLMLKPTHIFFPLFSFSSAFSLLYLSISLTYFFDIKFDMALAFSHFMVYYNYYHYEKLLAP